eukprot:3322767-Lingulodinium_polyedra.AAC.1
MRGPVLPYHGRLTRLPPTSHSGGWAGFWTVAGQRPCWPAPTSCGSLCPAKGGDGFGHASGRPAWASERYGGSTPSGRRRECGLRPTSQAGSSSTLATSAV